MLVKITGRALIIKFIAAKAMQSLQKFKPEALSVTNDDKEEIFRVAYKQGATASVGQYGIQFNDKDTEGNAQATFPIPVEVKDRKAWVKDNFFQALAHLEQLEPSAIAAADAADLIEQHIDSVINVD